MKNGGGRRGRDGEGGWEEGEREREREREGRGRGREGKVINCL